MPHAGESPATRFLRLTRKGATITLSIVDGSKVQSLVFKRSQYLSVITFANQVAETGELVLEMVERSAR